MEGTYTLKQFRITANYNKLTKNKVRTLIQLYYAIKLGNDWW